MYKGGFQNGKMHGKGAFVWSSGEMYDGEWQNNDQQGTGVMTQKDGTVLHSGSWAYGKVNETTRSSLMSVKKERAR
jgi:hypothetical protein